MAYTEEEKKGHIKEVHQFLRNIAQMNSSIPTVVPSGVYDNTTEQAVRSFQQAYGLPVTGKVDRATWDKLLEAYLVTEEYYAELVSIHPFGKSTRTIKEGESGFNVYIVQAMLNTIFSLYSNFSPIKIDGNYGAETVNAVKQLQEIINEPATGELDYKTWNKLAKFYNSIK